MKLVYKGKTKDVYELEDGNYLLKFKDDVTGEDGVFDPGANSVGLTIEGMGRSGLKLTKLFFEKINEKGIPTHYIDCDIDAATMTVKPATMFAKALRLSVGIERGKFYSPLRTLCQGRNALDAYVEVTLKDDERQDPLINEDVFICLASYQRRICNTKRFNC